MNLHFLKKYRSILLYAASMALLVFVMKWLQWKYIMADHSSEVYLGMMALFFTILGIWLSSQIGQYLRKSKTSQTASSEVSDVSLFSKPTLESFELSEREMEVLQLINQGKSNAENADELCLSVSTIKTHVSNIFVKLDVKSRTQAIDKFRSYIQRENLPLK